jgi:glycosyltransferase involved in cell wall biosynthesis
MQHVPVKISVILPVYNGMAYLEKSVRSVLSQHMKLFEFLIVDDCSTDDSYIYLSGLQDERVKLFKNETNKGLFFNLNFLISQCSSPLIKLWSQDDVMYPDCLTAFVDFHRLHPTIGFSYSNRDYINEKGEITISNIVDETPAIIDTEMHSRIAFYTGSIAGNIANVAISKAALNKVGLFNEEMKISGDFEMWVRIARYYTIGFINKPLVQLRNHSRQLSSQEQYYVFHVIEDLQSYRYLLSYCSPQMKVDGLKIMHNHKLNFYYTLMLKALLKGRFRLACKFATTIGEFTNIMTVSIYYLKNKLLGVRHPKLFDAPFGQIQKNSF